MKKIGEVIAKAVFAVIFFIKYIVIENFRGFIGLIGLALIIIAWLKAMLYFEFDVIYIFGAGLLLELIVWATGPIKITFTKGKKK